MATYLELFALKNDSDLQDRVTTAIAIKAKALRDSVPPALSQEEKAWVEDTAANPVNDLTRVLWVFLADNAALTVVEIQGLTDIQIQTSVDTAVDSITSA